MNDFILFMMNNKEWLFSGIGTSIALGVLGYIFTKKHSTSSTIQKIKTGNNSVAVQIHNDTSKNG